VPDLDCADAAAQSDSGQVRLGDDAVEGMTAGPHGSASAGEGESRAAAAVGRLGRKAKRAATLGWLARVGPQQPAAAAAGLLRG
jgi:hypothetical protein